MRWLVALMLLVLPVGDRPVSTTTGDDKACLPLVVTNPDGNYIVPGVKGGIVYRRVEGRDLMLDAWAPLQKEPPAGSGHRGATRPGVVVIHGGGFTSGSRVAFVGQFLELLTSAGYPWLSVDYRLNGPSRVADAVDDVRAALAFARCHAAELGINGDRLVLLGEDAGAALAVSVADRGAPGVIGAVLLGGLIAGASDAAARVASTGVAPTRVAPGRVAPGLQSRRPTASLCDSSSSTARRTRKYRFARAETWCRQRAADTCELLAIEGASHRPENWWPVHWQYKSRVVDWLKQLAPVPSSQAAPPGIDDLSKPLAPGLHKRIPYVQAGPEARTEARTGNQDVPRVLDAWLPADRSRPAHAVVLLHGGGWEAGDRVTYITPLFEPLARAGFAWFSVDYRLTPAVRHPDQLNDIRAALTFIRANARVFGIDASRLALVGESASAQMATLLAERTVRLPASCRSTVCTTSCRW